MMEDRNRKGSPMTLFKQCGLEKVYVYKDGGVYNGTVYIHDIDDRIRNKGSAKVVKGFTKTGKALRIFLKDQAGDIYACEWIVFDYVLGEFFVGVSKNTSNEIIFLSMDEVLQMAVAQQEDNVSFYLPPV